MGPLEVTVGNAASPHLTKVWPFEPPAGSEQLHVESHPPLRPLPVMRTVVSALNARRSIRRARRSGRSVMVRAHGAGRAGLIATILVDPHPYVIIYGTEVMGAPDRGRVTRWLTAETVRRASGLAVASTTLMEPLDRLVAGSSAKTDLVPMPVAWDAFRAATARTGDPSPRALSVRQIRPLYRVREVVEAHDGLGDDSVLALLRGSIADGEEYAESVIALVQESAPRAEVLPGFFDRDGLVAQCAQSDVIISIPEHDQMSVAMLEGLGAGCVGVISDLETYAFLRHLSHVIRVVDPTDVGEVREALRSAFALAAA